MMRPRDPVGCGLLGQPRTSPRMRRMYLSIPCISLAAALMLGCGRDPDVPGSRDAMGRSATLPDSVVGDASAALQAGVDAAQGRDADPLRQSFIGGFPDLSSLWTPWLEVFVRSGAADSDARLQSVALGLNLAEPQHAHALLLVSAWEVVNVRHATPEDAQSVLRQLARTSPQENAEQRQIYIWMAAVIREARARARDRGPQAGAEVASQVREDFRTRIGVDLVGVEIGADGFHRPASNEPDMLPSNAANP